MRKRDENFYKGVNRTGGKNVDIWDMCGLLDYDSGA